MEWMDPMSWRLPSGKALAEFALQTASGSVDYACAQEQEETGGIGNDDESARETTPYAPAPPNWSLVAGGFTRGFIVISRCLRFSSCSGRTHNQRSQKAGLATRNSASALPEGRRQLIGSIHSIGR